MYVCLHINLMIFEEGEEVVVVGENTAICLVWDEELREGLYVLQYFLSL